MKNVILPKIFLPFFCHDLIRIGKDNDGGYLVNRKDIDDAKTLLSFGIGEDVSFEKSFLTINKCPVHAYDETIGNEHRDFFIDDRILYHENVLSSNINDILERAGDSVFLNCDIDGGEYEILYDLIQNSHRFTGLAIEFHGVSRYHEFNELTNFIAKFDLRLIHVHINNYAYIIQQDGTYIPDVIELTFSSSRKNTEFSSNVLLPHCLDMPNNPSDEEFRISF